MALAAGSKVPGFSVGDENEKTVTNADFKGKNVVLFFYPKADTPG